MSLQLRHRSRPWRYLALWFAGVANGMLLGITWLYSHEGEALLPLGIVLALVGALCVLRVARSSRSRS